MISSPPPNSAWSATSANELGSQRAERSATAPQPVPVKRVVIAKPMKLHAELLVSVCQKVFPGAEVQVYCLGLETLAGLRERPADLLVLGAYGRSRMREYLFGGVTRYFLNMADGPALLLAR